VACNAHARRKFHEARGSDELRAHQALAYYAQLYDLERAATANHFDDEQRIGGDGVRAPIAFTRAAKDHHIGLRSENPWR